MKASELTETVVARNRAQCRKCMDIIESKHRHDFVSCKCGAISIDGGTDYIRVIGSQDDYKNLVEIKFKHE